MIFCKNHNPRLINPSIEKRAVRYWVQRVKSGSTSVPSASREICREIRRGVRGASNGRISALRMENSRDSRFDECAALRGRQSADDPQKVAFPATRLPTTTRKSSSMSRSPGQVNPDRNIYVLRFDAERRNAFRSPAPEVSLGIIGLVTRL